MVDTNVDNYSLEELTTILGLSYPASEEDIIEKTTEYMDKYKKKNNPEMVNFFQDIQNALVEEDDLKFEEKNMTSQNVYNVPVQKDTLNPLLKNVTNRLVNIDSQYRDDTYESNLNQTSDSGTEYSSTYYNANLCEQLTNVLSITVDNIIIPKTWYVIDASINNNFFWITNKGVDYLVTIESGNYSANEFVEEMNSTLYTLGFKTITGGRSEICSFDIKKGILTLNFHGINDPSGSPLNLTRTRDLIQNMGETTDKLLLKILDKYAYFTFFDIGNIKMFKYIHDNGITFENVCSLSTGTIDGTLGWLMGFRLPYEFIQNDGNTPRVPLNLNGSSYFLISLQDYQTNRVSNDIITIVNKQNSQIALPEFITDSLLYKCIILKQSIPASIVSEKNVNDLLNASVLNSKLQQYIPSAPRVLTQSQIYTTNEIIKNNKKKSVNYRSMAPNTNDVIAIIPINTQGINSENLFIQDKIRTNKRVFFGPVNIDRFTVRLLNDKGGVVNLHGADWSFTLNVEVLYQI